MEAVAVDACDSALFLHFASQSNVDDLVLEQLDADIGRLAKSLVSQPVTTVFSEITTLRRLVFTLLQGRQHPRQTSHLYLTAGRLCGLATHVALDLGQFTAAATHARTAWLCAESADHNGLRAWVRSVQSLIAYWQQNYSQAVELAQSGLRHADAGTIRARLLSLSARAHAACGSGSAAVRAVEAARDARHGSAGPAELPGVFTFPEAKQHAYAGTALLAIDGKGHVRQAVEASSQAIALYRCSPEEDQSSGDLLAAHLDLATAHLAAGDIDGAAEKLSVVLTAPPERRTASISHRLQTVGLRLGEPVYAGSAVARGLRESVREACHRPAPAKPPEPDQ
ncbi:XRE family transcriptional regulator [Streptomyces sp. NPDC005955]|uniref:XRE family transcriptional regulator n=1 Tax=Streptomyces sp. NPDC005955 TaxID=3364738 RepID=UPI0036AD2FA0